MSAKVKLRRRAPRLQLACEPPQTRWIRGTQARQKPLPRPIDYAPIVLLAKNNGPGQTNTPSRNCARHAHGSQVFDVDVEMKLSRRHGLCFNAPASALEHDGVDKGGHPDRLLLRVRHARDMRRVLARRAS